MVEHLGYKSKTQKALIAIRVIKNYWKIPLDKLGLINQPFYTTKHYKSSFFCRKKSNDINEAVVIFSGYEYPFEYIKLNKKKPVIFDLGGNIGLFSLLAAKLNNDLDPFIVVVEPFEENNVLLQRNLDINNIKNYQMVEKACTSTDGFVFIDTSVKFDAIFVSKNGRRVDSIRLSTLAEEIGIKSIDLLKIDIEGSEYEVFESDYKFIKENVSTIILEWHYINERKNKKTIIDLVKKDFNILEIYDANTAGVLVATKNY